MKHQKPDAPQTELFPQSSELVAARVPSENPPPEEPNASRPDRDDDTIPGPFPSDQRTEMLQALLKVSAPVRAGGKAAAWLKARRIFKKTWDSQSLRVVENYRRTTESLLEQFKLEHLQTVGLFNKDGHFRFYRHTLLVPWFDEGVPVYIEAFAPEADAIPPVLTLAGPIPCPYNAALLDGTAGRLYLCAGSLDTLELLEAGFPAVGLPVLADVGHASHARTILKSSWMSQFHNKSMYLAFDGDAAGEADAARVIAALMAAGVEAHRVEVPVGKRVGDWIAGK